MSAEVFAHSSVVLVKWGTPEIADVVAILHKVHQVHRACGRPCTFIGLAPSSSEPPSEAVRKLMLGRLPELIGHCERIHAIVDDIGFRGTLIRLALAAMILGAGQRRKILVHTRIQHAVTASDASVRHEVIAAIRNAIALGLVSDVALDPPSIAPPRPECFSGA